jgi:hypothetical protein
MANNIWNEGKKLTCGPLDSIMFHSEQCGSCVGVCLWFVSSLQQFSAPLAILFYIFIVSEQCCTSWCSIFYSNMYYCMTSVCNMDILESVGKKFWHEFRDERVPSKQTIHNLVDILRTTRLLLDKKQKHKCRVLTEEKLDDTGAKLEHTPRKLLKRLAQDTGVSKSSARMAIQLLMLRPYKTTVIHARLAATWSS